MYQKIRKYNSDVHIYVFDPRIERIDADFGVRGKLEPLSQIGKPAADEEIACKINATFFGGNAENYGTLVDEGKYYTAPSPNYLDVIFTKDYKLKITHLKDLQEVAYWQGNGFWVIGGSFSLVLDGKINITNTDIFPHWKERHPRTAIGQKANGNIVLVVVQGRTTDNSGVTGQELADIMLSLGCVNAVNLDGGGSSEMIVGNKIVNQPTDGKERLIGVALIVYKKKEVKGMKVYISPSTQENNVGVGNYGTEEKRMNEIADIVCPLLEYNGFTVKRNRPEMTLSQIIADSDAWKPDIHVAIHSNAMGGTNSGQARGCEVYGYLIDGKVTNSQRLSEAIYKEVSAITPTAGRGVKNGVPHKFAEVVTVKATSCIVEVAFHDNMEDAIWIMNNIPQIGEAIVKGICNYFGVQFKKPADVVDWKAKYEGLLNDIKALIKIWEG